jgi:hypothetical protein
VTTNGASVEMMDDDDVRLLAGDKARHANIPCPGAGAPQHGPPDARAARAGHAHPRGLALVSQCTTPWPTPDGQAVYSSSWEPASPLPARVR